VTSKGSQRLIYGLGLRGIWQFFLICATSVLLRQRSSLSWYCTTGFYSARRVVMRHSCLRSSSADRWTRCASCIGVAQKRDPPLCVRFVMPAHTAISHLREPIDSPFWKILHNHYEDFKAGHDKRCEKQYSTQQQIRRTNVILFAAKQLSNCNMPIA
jgi:hypothetical protein